MLTICVPGIFSAIFCCVKKHYKEKAILFLTLNTWCISGAIGQTISGRVVDTIGKPVQFVNLTVFRDTNYIAGAVTDSAGLYKITIHQPVDGICRVKLELMGYKTQFQEVNLNFNSGFIVKDFVLKGDINHLHEVTVKDSKPIYEQKVDRFVFNVENSPLESTGSNAFEAITKAPGVISSSGTLSIVGKGSVSVMINGRLIHLSGNELYGYLSSIPSENISSVEIITTPGAKYDASGDGGIINIVTKKNKNEGLVLFTTSTYEQRTKPSEGETVNFNYLKGRLNLYGFVNANNTLLNPVELTTIYYPDATWVTQNERNMTSRQSSFELGMDLQLSKKSTLSAVTSGNFFGNSDETANAVTNITSPSGHEIDSTEYILNSLHKTTHYKTADINYHYLTDTKGSSLSFTFDYLEFDSRQNQLLSSNSFAGAEMLQASTNSSLSPQNISNVAAKADYELFLPKKQRLAFGLKSSFSKTDNNYTYFDGDLATPDTSLSNHFIYTEDVQALYGSYSKDWSKNSIQIGVRTEYTSITTRLVNLDQNGSQQYVKLFPSLFFLHSFNDKYKINFNFNIRINRPAYWELNPFKYYISNYSYSEGNPALQPSYTDNFQFGITLNNKYYLTPYLQIENNHFQQVPVLNVDSNYFYYTRLNVGTIVRYGLSFFTPTKFSTFWTLNTQLNVFQAGQQAVYLNNNLTYHQVTFYCRLNNQFTISSAHNFYAELNWTYNSASQSFIYYSQAYNNLDVGLRKSLGKRGSVGLYCFDVFKTYPYLVSTDYYDQKSNFKNEIESRFIRLTFSYKLGSQNVKQKQTRSAGNSEEKGRLN